MDERQIELLSRLTQAPLELLVRYLGEPRNDNFLEWIKKAPELLDQLSRMRRGAPTNLIPNEIQSEVQKAAEFVKDYLKKSKEDFARDPLYAASSRRRACQTAIMEHFDGPWYEHDRRGIGENLLSRADPLTVRMNINTGLLAPTAKAYPPHVIAPWGEVNRYLVKNLGVNP